MNAHNSLIASVCRFRCLRQTITSILFTLFAVTAFARPTTTSISSSLNPSCVSATVTFTAVVSADSGTPTGTVQFYDGTSPLGSPVTLVNGTATKAVSSLTAGNHTMKAVYSGASGFSGSTSPNLTQTVNALPAITGQPVGQTLCAGGAMAFNVSATGAGLTYRWRKGGVNLSNGGNISGATTASLSINPANVGDAATAAAGYDCVVSGLCNPPVTSTRVALTVNTPPSITSQPISTSGCAGSTVSFTVGAIGNGLVYQWRKNGVNLSNGGNISGADTSSLVISSLGAGDVASPAAGYDCIISGVCNPAVTSARVGLSIDAPPAIVQQPVSATTCDGFSTTFTVAASGAGLTYQWRRNGVNLSNDGRITGVNTATLFLTSTGSGDVATAAAGYDCVVGGSCTPSVTSTRVALTLNGRPTSSVSGRTTINRGSSATIAAYLSGTPPFVVNWNDGFSQTVADTPATRVVSPNTSTTYAVSSLSDANCIAFGQDVFGCGYTVIVVPRTSATVTGGGRISPGGSASVQADLTGTSPWTVTWNDGTVQTVSSSPAVRTVSPTTTSFYAVTSLSDASGQANPLDISGSATVEVLTPTLRRVVVNANFGDHQWPNAIATANRAPPGWEPWLGGVNLDPCGNDHNEYKALNLNTPYGDAFIQRVVEDGFAVIDNYGGGGNVDAGYYALTHGACVVGFHSAPNDRHYFDYDYPTFPLRGRGPCPTAIVAGGGLGWQTSANAWGPQGEFIDSICYNDEHGAGCGCGYEDTAQSWAHGAVGAKFATVRDAHSGWNPFDIRQYLRQVSTFYNRVWTDPVTSQSFTGWRPDGGYGFSQVTLRCGGTPYGTPVDTGLPPLDQVQLSQVHSGPPLLPWLEVAVNRQTVTLHWKNWLQTGFIATVIKFAADGIEANATEIRAADSSESSYTYTQPAMVTGTEKYFFYTKLNNGSGEKWSRTEVFTILSPALPTIVTAPQSQSVPAGASVTLSVQATIPYDPARPLRTATFQWYHNGIPIAYANFGQLSLYNVTAADAGDYTVEVSGPMSSITTAPATLTVLKVATPSLSPPGGRYCSFPNGVVISCATSGAEIHYTVDGSIPTVTDPIIISGNSVAVSSTLTLKARAFKAGWADSDVRTEEYVIPTLVIRADNKVKLQGQPNPPLTGSIVGIVDNDNITATYTTDATTGSPIGTYTITPIMQDPDGKLPNYCTVTILNGVLKVVSFTIGSNQFVEQNAPPQTIPGFAVPYISGAVSFDVVTDLPNLFAAAPLISPAGTLTFTPATGASGVATVEVQMRDSGGTISGPSQTFTITINAPGQLAWEYNTGSLFGLLSGSSPAIGLDGSIYLGAREAGLIALNPNGTLKWVAPAPPGYTWSQCAPAIGADETVYSGTTDGGLYAFTASGTFKWRTFVGLFNSSPSVGVNGTIYCASDGLKAVGPDGALLWSYPANNTVYSSPAIAPDGTIYFGGMEGRLFAVTSSGSAAWTYPASGTIASIYSSPALAADGSIYFGALDGTVYGLNANGTLKWSVGIGAAVYSSPAIGTDGTVYIGADDNKVYAFDPQTGAARWATPYACGGAVQSAPAIGSDGTIYVGARDGKVHAITSAGAMRWRYTLQPATGSAISASPTIGPNGLIYIGANNGHFYAIQGSGTLANSPWPMFKQNIRHTGRVARPGQLAWQYNSGTIFGLLSGSSPAIGLDGSIYFGAREAGLIALNANGTFKWVAPAPPGYSWSLCAPAIGPDESVYSGTTDGGLYAFTASGAYKWRTYVGFFNSSPSVGADGTIYCASDGLKAVRPDGVLLWSYPANNTVYSSPAIAPNGTIYFGGMEGRLFAVSSSGSAVWTYPPSGTIASIYSSPGLGADGSIYFAGLDGTVYGLNANGTLRWSVGLGTAVYSSPAIGTDGTVYIGADDNKVYALDRLTGAARWATPYACNGAVQSAPAIGTDGTIYVGARDGRVHAITPAGTMRWRYSLQPATGSAISASPTIGPNGLIYLGSGNGYFYAIEGSGSAANSPWPMFKQNFRHTGRVQ